MKIIELKLKDKKQIDLIVNFLNQGKIIVYPTDTIYGLGCLATNKKAIDKIFKIKKREKRKPLLVLVSSISMAKKYCYINKKQEEVLREVWMQSPQPPLSRGRKARAVSVILKSRGILPKELAGGGDSLAMRLPKDGFLTKIVKSIGVPLVSTSVNISGEKNIDSIIDIEKHFKTVMPDLIVDAGVLKGKPSALVDLRNVEDIKVLRK